MKTETASRTAWFVGDGSLLIQAASIWRERGHRVEGIASREADILAWAHDQNIHTVPPAELAARASQQAFDYLFSVANLSVLPAATLALARAHAINFHDGFLPGYAGVNVPVWALLDEQPVHGVTWHLMNGGTDEGDILVQRAFAVAPDETAGSLNTRCFAAGIETFRELTEQITAGTLAPLPQDLSRRRYFGFYDRPPAAMVLDFTADAESVARTVRALDFGRYTNPVGAPKILLDDGCLLVGEAAVLHRQSGAPAGTVLALDGDALIVTTATSDVRLGGLRAPDGTPLHADDLARRLLRAGLLLPALDPDARARLTAACTEAARSEGHVVRLLSRAVPLSFALGSTATTGPLRTLPVQLPADLDPRRLASLFLAFAARKSGLACFDLACADPALRALQAVGPALFASTLPLHIAVATDAPLDAVVASIELARRELAARHPCACDLLARHPRLPRAPLPVTLLVDVLAQSTDPASALTVLIDTARRTLHLATRSGLSDATAVERLARQLERFLAHAGSSGDTPLRDIPLLSHQEKQQLDAWNNTTRHVPDTARVHTLFEAQAHRTPDRVALKARHLTLTYRELDQRANALAHALRAAGVGPDVLVGVFVDRSLDMVTALLATLKAGGAYLPLDPAYPADRLRFYIEDSKLAVIITDPTNEPSLPPGQLTRLVVGDGRLILGPTTPPDDTTTPDHLAYVIYTSGSSGQPKGVMVEHRNVTHFLAAMDDLIAPDEAGTWLAATSLSFDISVLELLWPLTHGFRVVIHPGDSGPAPPPVQFSLFYFAASSSPDGYRLLLEGARFADEHGFTALWTPERHFHPFGGLFPNPALTSAALAMITSRVRLRAGSCVSPLHSPLRITEEWAFVDNLSHGRVDVSFASGWQPNDFSLQPDAFAHRKEQMFSDIETVRRLWRGEGVVFKNGLGQDAVIHTSPSPIQKELPIWITAATAADTFITAGRIGASVLTHLLGQSLDDVARKITLYRDARRLAGHPGPGTVTLMLHTFLAPDEHSARETARGPMKEYLRSAVGLIKEAAWSFPTFQNQFDPATFDPETLSPAELDALLDHAFERYFQHNGLFGTVERALGVVARARLAGVDEIACLIDFGVPDDLVIASFPLMDRLREQAASASRTPSPRAAAQTTRDLFASERITHFQCTPSMASLLVLDDGCRAGIAGLHTMLVGGEALPTALARELLGLTPRGRLINVYGPTEATVWSSFHTVTDASDEIPIGRPLANTRLRILDPLGSEAPPGEQGELLISGLGVGRGYLHRPALTSERFILDPNRPGERAYRTGDLASFRPDGALCFGGRIDQQIKLRGHRVEPGEIEARLGEHPDVRSCVVIAREDTPGDRTLVAYVIPRADAFDPASLRRFLLERLPAPMVPTAFVSLPAFPQTPARKLDRQALPPPRPAPAHAARPARETPENPLEETIAAIWRELLNRAEVDVNDSFFDLGGHSLLAVQLLGRLRSEIDRAMSLVDLFRYPTIRSFAASLTPSAATPAEPDAGMARGTARQRARRAPATQLKG